MKVLNREKNYGVFLKSKAQKYLIILKEKTEDVKYRQNFN